MRGLLLEHDIALAQGNAALERGMALVLQGASAPVPELLRDLLADLMAEWEHLGVRIGMLNSQIDSQAAQDAKARQLMSIRGVGPITATALLAKQCEPERFANSRQFAAYFGLVDVQRPWPETERRTRACACPSCRRGAPRCGQSWSKARTP